MQTQQMQQQSSSLDSSAMPSVEQTNGLVMKILVGEIIDNIYLGKEARKAQKALEESLQDPALAYLGAVIAQRTIDCEETESLYGVLDSYSIATRSRCEYEIIEMLREKVAPYINSPLN